MTNHKLDTDKQVFFYEQEFYVLSNFSAFNLFWSGHKFDTAEHAYHWEKFCLHAPDVAKLVLEATSAHDAFRLGQTFKALRRPDWDEVKAPLMLDILRAKARQHPYVLRKLLQTGDRELVEDSWRDDYWGWGEHRNGRNMLGKLWMQVRDEYRPKP